MSASPITESACRSCGAELAPGARFCANCAARQRLVELEEEGKRIEGELAERLAGADKRIRRARLLVQETMMVTPNEPSPAYPPPDEGNPPQPAQVPEPYPPPDEGTPPTPAPDPGQSERE